MSGKILVVDDDVMIVELISKRLQCHSYQVVKACDGLEALEKYEKENPDLIILDVVMPRMDGYTFIKALRKLPNGRNVPVIVLTGREKMKQLFAVEGVREYLFKPYKPEELLEKVERFLKTGAADPRELQ